MMRLNRWGDGRLLLEPYETSSDLELNVVLMFAVMIKYYPGDPGLGSMVGCTFILGTRAWGVWLGVPLSWGPGPGEYGWVYLYPGDPGLGSMVGCTFILGSMVGCTFILGSMVGCTFCCPSHNTPTPTHSTALPPPFSLLPTPPPPT